MKSDINGCSTCANGAESYEEYYDSFKRKQRVQYDYRMPSGKLFSTIADTLELAREKRDRWLGEQG